MKEPRIAADNIVCGRQTCRHALLALLLAAISLGAGAGAGPDRFQLVDPELTRRPELERQLRQVTEALGGSEARCKRSLITLPAYFAICVDAPSSMQRKAEELRTEVQRQLQQIAGLEPVRDGWESTRSISRASFERGVQVTLHHKSAHVILAYQPSATACLSDAAREGVIDLTLVSPEGKLELPVVKEPVRPDYPAAARAERLGAYVLLGLRVEASGEVTEVCVADTDDQSNGFSMAFAAVEALQSSRFKPAMLNGEKIPVNMSMIITFYITERNAHQGFRPR